MTRPKPKLQVVDCPHCKHKTVKHIVRKGAGG